MKISEYRKAASQCLKGRRSEAFVVTAICLFVFLTFRSAAMLTAYLVGNMQYFPIIDTGITVLCFLFMTPLITGGFWWFYRTASGEDNSGLLKLYSGFRLNGRAALVYALMWSKGLFSLFPSAICFTAAYILLYGNTGLNGDLAIFVIFQLVMLGILLIIFYLNSLISMVLAPFLFISHPDRNPFGVVRESAKLMKGNKLRFAGLILGYIPIMLPVVTIPFVMPSLIMSAAVFARCVTASADSQL